MRGYTLLELLLVVTVMAIISGVAVPLAVGGSQQSKASAAARYLAGRLSAARFEAVRRSASVALRFRPHDGTYAIRTYVDGNGNGVSSADIASGIDRALSAEELIEAHFPGTTFGVLPLVEGIDSPEPPDPDDPIQIGPTHLLSFSPSGTSSSGTLYLHTAGRHQFAVRLLGSTGRARVLQFDFGNDVWHLR